MAFRQTPPALVALVRQTAATVGSVRAVARGIGISEGRLSRLINHGEGSMDVLNLLKLANFAEAPPGDVLRSAGKDAEADLIERLYGVAKPSMSPRDRKVLELWDRLSAEGQQNFLLLIEHVVKTAAKVEPAQPTAGRKRKLA